MIRRGPDGPSITWSSPMTDARIVSIRGDLGSRVSTPPLSHGSRPPGNTDPSYRNCRIASCAPQGCRRGDNAQHGESHPGHHRVACVAGDVTGSRRRTGGQMSPTAEAHTPARASGAADGSRDEPGRRRAAGWAGLLLLMAVAAGLLGQGAFYSRVRWDVGVLVALAAVLALVAWPPTRDDARLPPVVAALALAVWAVLDAALLGVPAAGAGPALLLLGVSAVLLACRRLGQEDREVLLLGVVGIGLLVALAGWLGVAGRVGSWAWLGDGVWRASSTLTYPNAAAAVLVPVALLVLAGLRGPRGTARAVLGPCVGALVALACLVPSMPAARPPRPALALAGLCAGLALAALVARLRRWPAVALVLGGALAGCLAAAIVVGGVGDATRLVAETRITLASPDRSGAMGAALRVAAEHPLTGAGPGQADLR